MPVLSRHLQLLGEDVRAGQAELGYDGPAGGRSEEVRSACHAT